MTLFGNSIRGNSKIGCAFDECTNRKLTAKELLFICPYPKCPGGRPESPHYHEFFENQAARYPERFLFRPKRFAYSVRCPVSDHNCHLKVCPRCGTTQPVSTGDASTIAVIGSNNSGKTCFITSLIQQIDQVLSRQQMYGISMEWRDDAGRKYFREQRDTMKDLRLPAPNQKSETKSLEITVRVPNRGKWRRLWRGQQGIVPLVFPDPAGEWFHMLEDTYCLTFLGQSPQVMLMLDPISSEGLRERRQQQGKNDGIPDDPTGALNAFIGAIRNETGNTRKLIHKDLAVVLTKCDEENVFDPDSSIYDDLHRQSGRYDPKLAARISVHVEQHLEHELGMPNVVALAKENFRRVSFFAASALGAPPIKETKDGEVSLRLVQKPEPRRVEEPFLWLLHCRGMI